MSKIGEVEFPSTNLSHADWCSVVNAMSDEQLQVLSSTHTSFDSPMRMNDEMMVDADGFPIIPDSPMSQLKNLPKLQKLCWDLSNENPQINSHVRDVMGTLAGNGFDVESDIPEIQEFIEFIMDDIRNELWKFIPKWAARSEIEGELFLALTIHDDGFIEVDFMEPSALKGGGDDNCGIYFHPKKATMPILYEFEVQMEKGGSKSVLIPSIYAAYYPQFIKDVQDKHNITPIRLTFARNHSRKYKKIGNFQTFIIAWDKGFLTKRNVSHIKTTIQWITHYTNLKKWEIDHKKSSGSYLWVVELTTMKAYRNWLKMTDKQKAETGLAAKKTPGGTLVLPPEVKLTCQNPKLASISEQDTDIMHMVTSGLNKPEDMVTGQTKGDTFSGIKASRGPQADRTKDEIEYWERFLRNDLWRSLLFLHSVMNKDFPSVVKMKKTALFKKQKPVVKTVSVPAYKLIEFSFPQSEIIELEGRVRALLGVNHQSIVESLGVPRRAVASAIGFSSYKKLRYEYADEEEELPELPITALLLAGQSQQAQGESTLKNTKKKDEGETVPPKKKAGEKE